MLIEVTEKEQQLIEVLRSCPGMTPNNVVHCLNDWLQFQINSEFTNPDMLDTFKKCKDQLETAEIVLN